MTKSKIKLLKYLENITKKTNNEYMVNLKLIEKKQTILSIYLDIPSENAGKEDM